MGRLQIQTTGLEEYAPGGNATLKVMIIGGPGAGKTRFSSYWPKPIYMNCEAGLSSIADRKMPFVNVNSSQDALDVLAMLKQESTRPLESRRFRTVVVDTIDAFQRKVKDEWLQANPASQSFRGFDAWGYLDTKMQMLLTRLLNLDMNVIVLCHYTDKTVREGVGDLATERQELQLQLSGSIKDAIFNDFDLVGWMGTYWEPLDGQRVEKRGLTFKRTPDKPFLKDRLHVTPPWMEVRFSDEDYADLFSAVISRLDDIGESEVIGEIESAVAEDAMPVGGVVGPQSGGALPPSEAKDLPLASLDKPTLVKMARDLGLKMAQNAIKAELIQAIEQKQAEAKAAPAESDAPAASPETDLAVATLRGHVDRAKELVEAAEALPSAAAATPVQAAATRPGRDEQATDDTPIALEQLASTAAATPVEGTPAVETEVGTVNPKTGEMSVEAVTSALGGVVLSDTAAAETESVAPAAAPAAAAPAASETAGETCSACGKDLAGENQDYVKLSKIKYRRPLCNAEYVAAKKTGTVPPAMAR